MDRVCISGVTLTGNKGGTSMLYATLDELDVAGDRRQFDLLSVYPTEDRRANQIPDLRIVSAQVWSLVCVHLPLALLFWPLSRYRSGRRVLSASPLFRSLLASSVVVDLSGIAFSDGRGLPILLYNVACCLPALLFGKRVVRLSQALGPFRGRMNRWLASRILQRCVVVVGRGDQTGRYLGALPLERYRVLPDTSFAMRVTEEARAEAEGILAEKGMSPPGVMVNPSQVVAAHCEAAGIDYCGEIAGFITDLAEEGFSVGLLPYSTVKVGKKNNDVDVCRRILGRVPHDVRVVYFDADYDARTLRALIGCVDFFVGSRFHAMISALAGGVPLLVIGWSHKYREVLGRFGLEYWAIDWRVCSRRHLGEQFRALQQQAKDVRERIGRHLAEVIAESKMNFKLVESVLQTG